MLRKELRKELIKRLNNNELTHLQASHGLGTTTLLKSLPSAYAKARNIKPLMKALTNSKGSVDELEEVINYNQSIVIDNAEEMTITVKRFLKRAINKGLTVLTAGTTNPLRLPAIKLKELSREESIKLVNRITHNKELSRIIYEEVGGKPALLIRAAKLSVKSDYKTSKGLKELIKKINKLVGAKELITATTLGVTYNLLQTIRYALYANHLMKQGFLIAMTAYLIKLIKSISRSK